MEDILREGLSEEDILPEGITGEDITTDPTPVSWEASGLDPDGAHGGVRHIRTITRITIRTIIPITERQAS